LLKNNDPSYNKKIAKNWQHDYCLVSFDAAPKFLMQLLRESKIKQIVRHYLPNKNPLQQVKRAVQKNVIWVPLKAGRHEIDLNFDLLEAIYNKSFKQDKSTFVAFEENNNVIKKYEITPPYIIIQPGAANGNLLHFSKLIICHDSGVMHLGDALEKPLLALFGPSDFKRVKPLRPTSHYLFSKTKYLNVKHNFKPFSSADLKKNESSNYPMEGLTVDEVFDKVRDIL